jgi:nicotinate-nucleotide adenylyltransferase
MKIGLLGGSFNPAHAGHVYLSKQALKRLGLDQVWWIISPQNPLKEKKEIADYALRVQKAREIAAKYPQIKICEVEAEQGFQYTIDTLRYVIEKYFQHRFLWLMGADNLLQFHQWKSWQEIFALLPIAVFDRGILGEQSALKSEAAQQFADKRLRRGYKQLVDAPAPCWVYVLMPKHSESATRLRNMLGKDAFLLHNAESINT